MEKREPSYTIGGNINWYNHYGEQNGGSLKKIQSYHVIQQSHSWHIPKGKHGLKGYMGPMFIASTVYNSQEMEATRMSIQMNG